MLLIRTLKRVLPPIRWLRYSQCLWKHRSYTSLEQDANIVLMLHSDDVNNEFQDQRFIKLFIRKNRDGRLGKINYTYYGDYIEFQEKKYDETVGDYVTTNYDVIGDV